MKDLSKRVARQYILSGRDDYFDEPSYVYDHMLDSYAGVSRKKLEQGALFHPEPYILARYEYTENMDDELFNAYMMADEAVQAALVEYFLKEKSKLRQDAIAHVLKELGLPRPTSRRKAEEILGHSFDAYLPSFQKGLKDTLSSQTIYDLSHLQVLPSDAEGLDLTKQQLDAAFDYIRKMRMRSDYFRLD